MTAPKERPGPGGWYGQDCCLNVVLPSDAHPVLIVDDDDVDPFTGEEGPGWPGPRIYWSNGTITEGGIDDMAEPPTFPSTQEN